MALEFRWNIFKTVFIHIGLIISLIVGFILLSPPLFNLMLNYELVKIHKPDPMDDACFAGNHFACSFGLIMILILAYFFSAAPGFMFMILHAIRRHPGENQYTTEFKLNIVFIILFPFIIVLTGIFMSNGRCLQNDFFIPFQLCQFLGFVPILAIYFFIQLTIHYYVHQYENTICGENKKMEEV